MNRSFFRLDGGPGSGPKGGSGSKHNIALPKNRKRLTIDQASAALAQMGFKLGKPAPFSPGQPTSYKVTKGGKTKMMSIKEIQGIIY